MSLLEQLTILKKEALRRPGAIATTVLLASLFMLGLGLLWTEKYESAATIHVENEKIIAPLLDGATVTESVEGKAELARQIIYRRDVMEEIMQEGGWLDQDPPMTLLERESLIEQLRRAIKIESTSENSFEITYRHPSPERAFRVVMTASSALLSRARDERLTERQNAYRFISAEVEKYKEQLQESESRLHAFLAEHGKSRPGSRGQVDQRVSDLRRDIQSARLDLETARIQERSLVEQLEGNAPGGGMTRSDELSERIAQMETELDQLRLRYHDTYPDVVSLRYQIEELRQELEAERNRPPGEAGTERSRITSNPMRLELRRELQQVRNQIASLEGRIARSEQWLEEEYALGVDVADVEAEAEALQRDYDVTREIYQDLLSRRESARIAMNMEQDGEGVNMSMQEPPTMPQSPSGLQLLHFALLGPFFGIGLAFTNLYLRVRFDERIRSESAISRDLAIPVLGSVPVLADATVKSNQRRLWMTATAAILTLIACYVFVASLRLNGLV